MIAKKKTVATTATTTPSERRHIEGPDPDVVSLESRSGPALSLSLSLSLFARVGWLDVGTDVLPMLTQQVQLVATRR